VLVVNDDIEVFLVGKDIFGWADKQANCFLEKGRERPERELRFGTS
jgi:hypothetical protein